MLMLLPMRTQPFLKIIRICKFCDILKFIYTDNYFQPFIPGNFFSQIQYFIGIPFHFIPIEID